MAITPHHNLTISLIRRNNFGNLRLRGAAPRRVVSIDHVHQADRLRLAPPVEHGRPSPGTRAIFRARIWPYDNAFPNDSDKRQDETSASTAQSTPIVWTDQIGRHIDFYA